MQNQNLMSSFEFIAALMSIIIGAGYYSAFIAMCLLDIAQTAVHGELLQPV